MVISTIAGLMEITLTMETVAGMRFPDKGLTRPENGDILRLQYVLHDALNLIFDFSKALKVGWPVNEYTLRVAVQSSGSGGFERARSE